VFISAPSGLTKKVNSSRVMIGNYERNSNTPSIDIILKIAKVFDVSIDYLAGEGQFSTYDKEVLKRIEDISNLSDDKKKYVFDFIDMCLRDDKTQKAYK